MEDLMTGWVQKANSGGNRWKKRFVVANFTSGTLAWFQDDPAFSLAKYRVKEEALGEVKLRGATVFTAEGQPSKVSPLPFLLKIVTADRTQLLCFPSKDQLEKWRAFVARAADPVAAADAAVAEAAAAGTGGGAGAPRASIAMALKSASSFLSSEPVDYCGWLLKAAPGWRTFQNRYCVLDSEELNVKYYDKAPSVDDLYHVLGDEMPAAYDPEHLPPIEDLAAREVIRLLGKAKAKPKGCIPLRGATISTKAWSNTGDAAGMLATSPTFSLTSDSGRVYAFVASSKPEMADWIARLQQAIDEADRIFNSGLLMGAKAKAPDAGAAADGSGDAEDAGGEVTQKQARRLSTVVPFKRAARATMASGSRAPGLPLYAAFLQNNKVDRCAGYLYKVDKSGRRWAYRYFVLRGSTCSYYADHTRRELKGSFSIGSHSNHQEGFPASASALEPPTDFLFTVGADTEGSDGSGAPTGMNSSSRALVPIKGKAAREHYLACNSAAEVRAWLDVIKVLVSAHRAKDGLEAFNEAALAKIDGSASASAAAAKRPSAAAIKSGSGEAEDDEASGLIGLDDDEGEADEDGATVVVQKAAPAPAPSAAAGSSSSSRSLKAEAEISATEATKEMSASLTAALRLGKSSKEEEAEEERKAASGAAASASAAGLGSVPEDEELNEAAATAAPAGASKPRAVPALTGRFTRVSIGGEDL